VTAGITTSSVEQGGGRQGEQGHRQRAGDRVSNVDSRNNGHWQVKGKEVYFSKMSQASLTNAENF